jgi:NTE family protein
MIRSKTESFDQLVLKWLFSIVLISAVPSSAFAEPGSESAPVSAHSTPCPFTQYEEYKKDKATRPTIGLALGGGGTRGAAHVGVLKVLKEEGIPIDYVAGTSMGAIVGGLYCAGLPPEVIEEKLLDMSLMHSFINAPIGLQVVKMPIKLTPRLVGHKSYVGLYDGRKFLKYLNKAIPACQREIATMHIPFCAVATNLLDGQAHDISSGNLGLAMLASSAVPSLRRPVPFEDKLFVDGGVMKNLPVDVVKKMGADIVIAVDVDENVSALPPDHFKMFGAVPRRLLEMQLDSIDMPAAKLADVVIHPNVDGISLISRKKADGVRAIKSGEESAQAAIPAIRALMASRTPSHVGQELSERP